MIFFAITDLNGENMANRSSRNECKTPTSDLLAYASGEGAFSLTMNGIAAFSMLFYTQALGLDHKLAGLALSISLFWDAITDPVMGHISDRTHSRFGRRHPYILIGGIFLALTFYFLWSIPGGIIKSYLLFWYLLVVNILIRTAVTVFYIPYLALGFEISCDYHERSRLQGARSVANMIANLCGPALAWSLFFKDIGTVQSTNVIANYEHMGLTFSIATLIIVFIVTFTTQKYRSDSRLKRDFSPKISAFFNDTKEIIQDKYSVVIYAFYGLLAQGMTLVASLQMYLYIYLMNFSSVEKTIAHGGTMFGFAIGSAISPVVARRLDKKESVMTGSVISIIGNLALAAIFLTGIIEPHASVLVGTWNVPIAKILFIIFNSLYWLGNGIIGPLTFSMVADTAEINYHKTGVLKDGSYSAMFSFLMKLANSVGLLIAGICLNWAGFIAGGQNQTPQAIHNLAMATFSSGILFAVLGLVILWRYPINKAFMDRLKANPIIAPTDQIV
jgi:glycoside/pentoside/hexuronide:cation symporter, GPH family